MHLAQQHNRLSGTRRCARRNDDDAGRSAGQLVRAGVGLSLYRDPLQKFRRELRPIDVDIGAASDTNLWRTRSLRYGEVWGDGLQKRDLVHAEDVVRASLLSLDHCNGFDVFNVASGQSHTVNEVLDAILRIDGFDDADIRHVNAGPTTLSERRFDGDKARRLLNFQPAIGLDAGLRRTIGWYRGTAEAG